MFGPRPFFIMITKGSFMASTYTQTNATAISVTGSSLTGWSVKIWYVDDDGNAVSATSENDKVVEQGKFIRDKWFEGKSVDFAFEVDNGVITSITTPVQKP